MKLAIIFLLALNIFLVECKLKLFKNLRHLRNLRSVVQNPQVTLPNGASVIGTIEKTLGRNRTYHSYRGIPYAQPPIGNLRFRAPVPIGGNLTNTIIHANKFGNPCLQPQVEGEISVSTGSEDCLTINIFVPRKRNSQLLSVMVWIYGGFFLLGSADQFGPDYLLNDNVIVVTFNYRVGAFGFLSTNDEASPGNYGLKDQILALQWVQENIEVFGGNKSSVTLFGESAGAVSIAYLSQTPLTKGLFQKIILESGSDLCLWGLDKQNVKMAFSVGENLGIFTKNSTELIANLRQVDATDLQAASVISDVENIILSNLLYNLPFSPTIEPNQSGAVITEPMQESYRRGKFNHIPHIIGFNSREGSVFIEAILVLARVYLERYELDPEKLVPASLNINNTQVKKKVAEEIRRHYFGNSFIPIDNESIVQFATDDLFSRPIIEHIQLISENTTVYSYNFTYEGALGNPLRIGPGVGHGEEIYYLWQSPLRNPQDITRGELTVRKRLIKLWTNFAKFSNPTPQPNRLLQNVTWSPSTPASPNHIKMLNIGKNLRVIEYENPHLKFWKRIFDGYGNAPFSTY